MFTNKYDSVWIDLGGKINGLPAYHPIFGKSQGLWKLQVLQVEKGEWRGYRL